MEDVYNEFNENATVKHPMFDSGVSPTKRKIFFRLVGLVAFFLIFYFFFIFPPSDFPTGKIFQIEEGSSLRSISLRLKEKNIIRSRTAFEAFVILLGRERGVISGDYYLENKLNVFEVARRISRGEHHLAPIAVTIPEGFDMFQIADTFSPKLSNFNKSKFLAEAKSKEGRLFPDTYFFLTTDNEEDVINTMTKNFEKKFTPLRKDINAKTENQIITMASILEREAKGPDDRYIISGILWRRLGSNWPLQVDAAPETYKKLGLPDKPICNPGLDSIKDALYVPSAHPLPPYLYYLHDKNGVAHYARTLSEHNANIRKYLK